MAENDTFVPTPAFKAFLEQTVLRTKDKQNIHEWFVTFRFTEKKITSHGLTFEIDVDTTYLCALITVSWVAQEFFTNGRLKELENDIAHELAHIITTPAHDFGTEFLPKEKRKEWNTLMEQLTQKIANLIS